MVAEEPYLVVVGSLGAVRASQGAWRGLLRGRERQWPDVAEDGGAEESEIHHGAGSIWWNRRRERIKESMASGEAEGDDEAVGSDKIENAGVERFPVHRRQLVRRRRRRACRYIARGKAAVAGGDQWKGRSSFAERESEGSLECASEVGLSTP
jgi:hypothetical protein